MKKLSVLSAAALMTIAIAGGIPMTSQAAVTGCKIPVRLSGNAGGAGCSASLGRLFQSGNGGCKSGNIIINGMKQNGNCQTGGSSCAQGGTSCRNNNSFGSCQNGTNGNGMNQPAVPGGILPTPAL